MCRREVSLNRRLAPDVYLGVADVSGPDERPCDHMVVMRRMPTVAASLPSWRRGRPSRTTLAWPNRLAGVHQAADRSSSIDDAARRDADVERWEANAAEMAAFGGQVLDHGSVLVDVEVVSGQTTPTLDSRGR